MQFSNLLVVLLSRSNPSSYLYVGYFVDSPSVRLKIPVLFIFAKFHFSEPLPSYRSLVVVGLLAAFCFWYICRKKPLFRNVSPVYAPEVVVYRDPAASMPNLPYQGENSPLIAQPSIVASSPPSHTVYYFPAQPPTGFEASSQ